MPRQSIGDCFTHAEMFLDNHHPISQALARLLAGAKLIHIAASALHRDRAGTIGRHKSEECLLSVAGVMTSVPPPSPPRASGVTPLGGNELSIRPIGHD
jgi:hypothetical protein